MLVAQVRWHSLNFWPLALVLGVGIVAAVVWLYPAQVRNVRRPWRWVLPGLRAGAMLVLVASLLQPVVQRLRRANEQGAVLVLLDRSRSMSVVDVGRTPAQLVAIADGLGRLPPGARAGETASLGPALGRLKERVDDVVSQGRDLETAEAFGRGMEDAKARLARTKSAFDADAKKLAARAIPSPELREKLAALDVPDVPSRDAWAADAHARIDAARAAAATFQAESDRQLYESNPQVKSACDELAQRSRASLVEQALFREGSGLVSRLGPDVTVVGYATGETVSRIDLPPVTASGDAAFPVGLEGKSSDVAGAVAAALADAEGRGVRAVVLFSDGRQMGGEEKLARSGVSPAGVPVFAVGVAPVDRSPDLAFTRDVSVPAAAFVGETVTVRAAITGAGLPAGAADVQLACGASSQTKKVEYKPDGTPVAVEFSLRMENAGPQRVALSMPAAPGEVTTTNNTVERWVKVLPERIRIAAYSGTPGWDFQLLRNLMSRTNWAQAQFGLLDSATPKLPLSTEEILRQDVLILSDVPVEALDDVQWDAVNRLVRERGGSLLLLAGPDHLPSSYAPADIVASSLLPFDVRSVTPNWRTWPGEQPAFRFVPPGRLPADVADVLRLGPGAGNLRHWQDVPAVFRFMPVPELSERYPIRPLLTEADSGLPVLTEGFPGNGRVLFFGANETWRWRNKVGGRDFDRFWRQLVHYAGGEPYAVRRGDLTLDVDKVLAAPGDGLTVRARVPLSEAATVRVEVVRGGNNGEEVVQSHSLTPATSREDGRFVATIAPLGEGEYVVRLKTGGSGENSVELPVRIAASAEAEMADVSGDAELLRRIADASGGQSLTLDRLGELPGLLSGTATQRSRYAEWVIWDSPLLFVFVVACLAAEWALRKRVGLA